MHQSLAIAVERFPIAGAFTIARGSRTESVVVTATISRSGVRGRGECVPYARYGETVEGVVNAIGGLRAAVEAGLDRHALQTLLPGGAARNALDCALWDLDAKLTGVPAHVLAGLDRVAPVVTAYTISLGSPAVMAAAAGAAAQRPLLKIKLGGEGDPARIHAVRTAAPDSELIVDANEAWRLETWAANMAACVEAGVVLIEQPFPAGEDAALATLPRPIPICADESVHDRHGLAALRARYDAINIKLDKTGGLTEALLLAEAAERLGFALFIGCMVGTSLAMAPAVLLTPRARFVDLDGPLLLAQDRPQGLRYEGSVLHPPGRELWG